MTSLGTKSQPQPLVFGAGESGVFGWYHRAQGDALRGAAGRVCGVVLCNPFGYEATCSHRAYRALAERLATAGFPVLRFDYQGTGDSAGADDDPGRVRAWLDSIGAAVDELRSRSGVSEVSLFGVRLGATLAMVAAAEHPAVSSVVLWAPSLKGKAYVREMRAFRAMAEKDFGAASVPPAPLREGDEEAGGFLLGAETIAALGKLDLLAIPKLHARRALVIARDDMPGEQPLVGHLQSCGVEATLCELPGYAAMMTDPHRSRIPVAVFQALVSWLEEGRQRQVTAEDAPPARVASIAPSVSVSVRTPSGVTLVREEAMHFGGDDRLFGILTEPAARPPSGSPAVLFLNAGAVHRIGPNRMYTTLARTWAALGFTCFRFDVTGLGDSPGGGDKAIALAKEETSAKRMYSEDSIGDVLAAMKFLGATRGIERFVLVGLCSGAYVAFQVGLQSPAVVGEIMINPQTFYWKEGDSVEVRRKNHDEIRRKNYDETRHYQKSLFRKESWAKALRGEVNFGHVFDVLSSRAKMVAQQKLRSLADVVRGKTGPQNEVARAFLGMADRAVNALLVFSGDDPGLDYVEMHLGKRAKGLPPRGNLNLEVVHGPDHTFTPLWSQQHLHQVLTQHLLRWGNRPSATP